jgi:hypothetical protein
MRPLPLQTSRRNPPNGSSWIRSDALGDRHIVLTESKLSGLLCVRGCPVRAECLAFALNDTDARDSGVWAHVPARATGPWLAGVQQTCSTTREIESTRVHESPSGLRRANCENTRNRRSADMARAALSRR